MKKIIVILCLFVSLFSAYQIITAQNITKIYSISELERLAKNKDADAQLQLGMRYLTGDGKKYNTKEAKKWITRAAENGNVDAQTALGCLYLIPNSCIERNEAEGLKWSEKASQNGSFISTYRLIQYYFEHDMFDKAFQYANIFEQQSKEDYKPTLKYNIGLKFYDNKNFTDAFNYFGEASQDGNMDALFMQGYSYFTGHGTDLNYTEAVNLWQKGAENENIPSLYYLGLCYELGKGVGKDTEKSEELFRRAAESGLIVELAEVVEETDSAVWDMSEAEIVLDEDTIIYSDFPLTAVEIGEAKASDWEDDVIAIEDDMIAIEEVIFPYDLSDESVYSGFYEESKTDIPDGILGKLNYEPAINGDALAQYNMGNFYYYGIEAIKSPFEAERWYSKASAQGFMPAKEKLARIKFDLGLENLQYGNKANAFKYFTAASAQGYFPAKAYLGACHLYGYGVKKNKTEGLNMIKEAADSGCAEGENLLGVYYYYQSNVGSEEEDVNEALYEKAIKLLKSAALKGNNAAKFNYGFAVIWDDKETGKNLLIEAAKDGDIAAKIWIENDSWASDVGFTEDEIWKYGYQYPVDDWEMLYEQYHHIYTEYH